MAKILFAPFSIAGGMLAGLVATRLFGFIWGRIDDREPPGPDDRQATWAKLVAALVLEGAIFRLVRGAFDHGARAAFYRSTRTWPGDKQPDRA